MNEWICDFGFAICDLAAANCRNPRGGHDGGQFACLLSQRIHFGCWQQAAVNNQFHPITRLVSFFFHSSELGDEFGFGASATSGAVVRADRRSASQQLISQIANRKSKIKNP